MDSDGVAGPLAAVLDQMAHPQAGDAGASSEAKEFEWGPPSVGGFCVPEGFDDEMAAAYFLHRFAENSNGRLVDQTLLTAWPSTSANVIAVPSLNTIVELENFRWSIINGYIPPTDGTANGFPVQAAHLPHTARRLLPILPDCNRWPELCNICLADYECYS